MSCQYNSTYLLCDCWLQYSTGISFGITVVAATGSIGGRPRLLVTKKFEILNLRQPRRRVRRLTALPLGARAFGGQLK